MTEKEALNAAFEWFVDAFDGRPTPDEAVMANTIARMKRATKTSSERRARATELLKDAEWDKDQVVEELGYQMSSLSEALPLGEMVLLQREVRVVAILHDAQEREKAIREKLGFAD